LSSARCRPGSSAGPTVSALISAIGVLDGLVTATVMAAATGAAVRQLRAA
jgi:hypothetical protein